MSFHHVQQHSQYTLLTVKRHLFTYLLLLPTATTINACQDSHRVAEYNQFTLLRRPDRPRYLRVHRAKEGRGMGQVLPLLKRELVLPFNTLIQLFACHHLATLVSWIEGGGSQLGQTATLVRCGNNL